MNPDLMTAVLWLAWIVSWWAAALWRDRAVKRPPLYQEVLYRLFVIAGAILLSNFFRPGTSHLMLWSAGSAARWTLVALEAAGFAFTWWARISLGRLWSSSITQKADHRVVDTGPYGLVRHPIYTGIILAETATALQAGSVQALVGAALMFIGWYIKARQEESFLREELDPEAYDAYARRVPMLVPFAPA